MKENVVPSPGVDETGAAVRRMDEDMPMLVCSTREHYCRANIYRALQESLYTMASSGPPSAAAPDAPAFLDSAMLEHLEGIPEPALILLPGGRIAAVNREAARHTDLDPVGKNIRDIIERHEVRRADGSDPIPGDMPYNRALRGEYVMHGERFDTTLSDGSVFRVIATSTPVIVDGKVVAALSVWHDFDGDLRLLTRGPESPDSNRTAERR